MDGFEKAETYSKNYQGKVPKASTSEIQKLETSWWESKDEAKKAIQIEAVFLECDVVVDLEFEKGTDSASSNNGKGTYYYSIWKATGIAYKSAS